MKKDYIKFISITLLILLLDQVTKFIVSLNNLNITIINKFLSFTFTKNTGVAFSLLQNKLPLIILVSVVALIYLTFESIDYIKKSKFMIYLSMSFIIGGLLGNLVDRIIHGYVIDFISFNIFSYNAPIFNIADSFLVVGAFMLVYFVVKDEKNGNKSKKRRHSKKA